MGCGTLDYLERVNIQQGGGNLLPSVYIVSVEVGITNTTWGVPTEETQQGGGICVKLTSCGALNEYGGTISVQNTRGWRKQKANRAMGGVQRGRVMGN